MNFIFSPKSKKTVFFDLKNTLLDDTKTYQASFIATLNDFTARWKSNGDTIDVEEVYKEFKGAKNSKLSQLLKSRGLNTQEQFDSSFFKQVHQQKMDYAVPMPGAIEVLKQMSEKYKLAIISNTPNNSVKRAVQALGISSLISENHIVAAHRRHGKKPSSAIFMHALKKTDSTPAESVMVGNSWKNDIMGATSLGIDCVWIRSKNQATMKVNAISKCRVVYVQTCQQLDSIFE